MAKPIKINSVTQDNFKEFGTIISRENLKADAGDESFTWWDKLTAFENIDSLSVNILEAKKRDLVIEKMEHHTETPELVVPMGGDGVVFVVAPKGELQEEKLKAFYLEKGKGVMLNTGVRHFIPYPEKKNTDCLIVFKDATGANDIIWEELSESYQLSR